MVDLTEEERAAITATMKRVALLMDEIGWATPLSDLTEAPVRALIEEANKRGLTLHVDHIFVYTGPVKKMREMVQNGDLGKTLYYDSTRINLGLFQRDVNVIADLAVHDFSILDSE